MNLETLLMTILVLVVSRSLNCELQRSGRSASMREPSERQLKTKALGLDLREAGWGRQEG